MDRTLHVEGHVLRLQDRGQGHPVVLLHNGGTSHSIWRHQLVTLSRTHRVLALDLPGYGASQVGAGGIDLDGHVACVAALLDELDEPATLVGNCMGSAIALRLAAARPGDVHASVLLNPLTTATFGAGRLGRMQRAAARWPRAARGARSVAGRLRTPAALGPAVLRLQLGPRGRAAGLHHDPSLLATGRRPEQLAALTETLFDLPCSYGLERLQLPADLPTVTVVWGGDNQVLDVDAAAELHRRLGAEPIVLDGCGHLAMLEDPAAVTAAIRHAAPPAPEPLPTGGRPGSGVGRSGPWRAAGSTDPDPRQELAP